MTSILHIAQRDELRHRSEPLHEFREAGHCRHRVVCTESALWVVTEWGDGAELATRAAFSPGALRVEELIIGDAMSVEVRSSSTIGEQSVTITANAEDDTVSARTVLHPRGRMTFEGWPRDVVADAQHGAQGTVHASQRGLRTGLVHASLSRPGTGSFMYVQDLTVVSDFCQATHASAQDTVGGQWPDLGFCLPVGSEPLGAAQPVPISGWHVAFAREVPDGPVAIADQYLEMLARLYLHLDRPTPKYVDWRTRAEECRRDLERGDDCWLTVGDSRYLRAYVGDDNHPPESMVQFAVLLPLIERSEWLKEDDPLIAELAGLAPKFHDDRVGSLARWLPEAEDMLDAKEPHEKPRVMDSWYILHPLLNLARLAERGNDAARQQFLKSLEVEIKIAHHFKYQWPVFYDVDTLEVIRAESEPGKGGELDVPGLYAHVLIQAFELTDDRRYLDEAIAASEALRDKGFELAYQLNNVVFGMTAMNRLSAITGDHSFLEISRVLCACLFDNVGLWSMRYGHARDSASFFGVFPMPAAPYTAAYEDAEVSAAALDYILCPGDGLPGPLAVLLPELLRHVTARLDTYYPANIVPDALTDSPKTGHIVRELTIPVEDLGDGWDKVGTVGQEVYGAGIAFSTLVRSYLRVPDRGEQIYCEYPWSLLSSTRDRVEVKVHGDPRLQCRVRVLADGQGGVHLDRVVGSTTGELSAVGQGSDWCDFWVSGGQDLEFTFS